MPELPEVETIRKGLAAAITGQRIAEVYVLHPRVIRKHLAGAQDFATTLRGRVFGVPQRRGKFLWLPFEDGDALLAHLGMSGQFRVDAQAVSRQKHARVEFWLAAANSAAGQWLRFVDQRMFGSLFLSSGGAEQPAEISHIAKDLFDPNLDIEALAANIFEKRSAIKRVLLNQQVVSGIGNIYADEALWQAKIHYACPANTLRMTQIVDVLDAARQVMRAALAQGGTSFDALYVSVSGESGYFERSLAVYGCAGKPCLRCATCIERDSFMGRSSFFCPRCQPIR